jgi:hypothetical protein
MRAQGGFFRGVFGDRITNGSRNLDLKYYVRKKQHLISSKILQGAAIAGERRQWNHF